MTQLPNPSFHIVGGGLAGSEACYQLLKRGYDVTLYEMRPAKMTPAHKTNLFAELVCSNSLKSLDSTSAPGMLKNEMEQFQSLILQAAKKAQVPAGQALAVDRNLFSTYITNELKSFIKFKHVESAISEIPDNDPLEANNQYWIVATGPLTDDRLAKHLEARTERKDGLYFYDAIAPTIETDSLDMDLCFRASRYNKGSADYINVPLTKEEYEQFIDESLKAEKMPLHDFEKPQYFESCLPYEVMVERGRETLRFGPMKPVGLVDPRTGKEPYAAIQLRQENKEGTMVSMVGFQTKMKWPEQKRVFQMIPALRNCNFLRYGTIHRNTYVNGPKVLNSDLSLKVSPRVFLAGQITGVEGYTESTGMGLLAGLFANYKAKQIQAPLPPKSSALGALLDHVTQSVSKNFQPMNCNFGLLPTPPLPEGKKKLPKKIRKELQVQKGREDFAEYVRRQLSLAEA